MDEIAVRLRGLATDFERLINAYEEKISIKETIIARLEYAFNDRDLAKTVYDFAVLGHLSYANQLRARFTPVAFAPTAAPPRSPHSDTPQPSDAAQARSEAQEDHIP